MRKEQEGENETEENRGTISVSKPTLPLLLLKLHSVDRASQMTYRTKLLVTVFVHLLDVQNKTGVSDQFGFHRGMQAKSREGRRGCPGIFFRVQRIGL